MNLQVQYKSSQSASLHNNALCLPSSLTGNAGTAHALQARRGGLVQAARGRSDRADVHGNISRLQVSRSRALARQLRRAALQREVPECEYTYVCVCVCLCFFDLCKMYQVATKCLKCANENESMPAVCVCVCVGVRVCVCVGAAERQLCVQVCVMAPLINVVIAPKCTELQQTIAQSGGCKFTCTHTYTQTYMLYIAMASSTWHPLSVTRVN